MNGRLLCYVVGFTQLPQYRKAATYFMGLGGHGHCFRWGFTTLPQFRRQLLISTPTGSAGAT